MDVKIAPKGINMVGYYRECGEPDYTRLIPCRHIRCQSHRKDMAIKDWVVEYIKPTSEINKFT